MTFHAARRILVLEDEPLIALDARDALESECFCEVYVAESVESALDYLQHQCVDAAILDFNLRDKTCRRVAERLLADHIPMAIVSGAPRSDIRREIPGAGQVFSKPADYARVAHAILG